MAVSPGGEGAPAAPEIIYRKPSASGSNTWQSWIAVRRGLRGRNPSPIRVAAFTCGFELV